MLSLYFSLLCLQNNLNEYYVMINWVQPNLLGTTHEFKLDFSNKIDNGGCCAVFQLLLCSPLVFEMRRTVGTVMKQDSLCKLHAKWRCPACC